MARSVLSSPTDTHYPSSTDSLLEHPSGTQRVKFMGAGPQSRYDHEVDANGPIDISLVLPHYRARNQPIDHRLSMSVGNYSDTPIKVKVCRTFTPTRVAKFHLEVHSSGESDVVVWLPSDFKGHIHRASTCKKVSFSPGFTNKIMSNVCLTQARRPSVVQGNMFLSEKENPYRYADIYISDADPYRPTDVWSASQEEDEVIVNTSGNVTFKMWDIHRGEPEAHYKETAKRIFGFGCCSKRSPEVSIDWDFLLDD